MMKLLSLRLKELKLSCESEKGEQLKIKLRETLSRVSARQCISTD